MYLRVWEYEVQAGQVDEFIAEYGAQGAWAQLFWRAEGFAGTRLLRDVDRAGRFLTIDRWADASCWEAFMDRWGEEYRELDRRLHGLASGGDLVIEGEAPAGG